MKSLRRTSSFSISETRWLAYATAGVAGAFGLSSSAEAEIHYSGDVSIKLTGNAQASLPLSNGVSLVFENLFGGGTFLQDFYFSIKGVISASAREGRIHHWLLDLPTGENVSAGTFRSVAGNPDRGIIFTFWSDGYFQPYYGPEVLLVSDSIPVRARNTAGREYRREGISTIALMKLSKITLGAMWATALGQDKRAHLATW